MHQSEESIIDEYSRNPAPSPKSPTSNRSADYDMEEYLIKSYLEETRTEVVLVVEGVDPQTSHNVQSFHSYKFMKDSCSSSRSRSGHDYDGIIASIRKASGLVSDTTPKSDILFHHFFEPCTTCDPLTSAITVDMSKFHNVIPVARNVLRVHSVSHLA